MITITRKAAEEFSALKQGSDKSETLRLRIHYEGYG
jgi:Fe-S cluster assembly iron-binding protein IscA